MPDVAAAAKRRSPEVQSLPHRTLPPALLLALTLAPWPGIATELPPEGRCPGAAEADGAPAEDAIRAPLRTGDEISWERLRALRELLPSEIWRHRDAFFFDGMRLTIGACHRRYAPSRAYAAATRENAGRARLDGAGNLIDHSAGLPFAPESIDASAADAGTRWAWNLERRERGAGPRGSFRILDLPDSRALASRTAPQQFSGEFFFAQTGARADLPNHQAHEARRSAWVAGGSFREPADARGIVWRQSRPLTAATDAARPDDIFVYVPDLRKLRRAGGALGDGIFVPRYRAAGQGNARAIPYAQGGRLGAIEAGHGAALAVAEDIGRGFTGLALRPNAWTWRIVAERELVAPLAARSEGWPLGEGRNYGPSGLSLASDAWDVRWAVAIEGRARRALASGVARMTFWIDVQTAQPLYVIARDADGALREIGVLAHRYSGDVASYPALPDGAPANVFDPVAAAFLALPSGGWRRESWDARSLPLDPDSLRALISIDRLSRGH